MAGSGSGGREQNTTSHRHFTFWLTLLFINLAVAALPQQAMHWKPQTCTHTQRTKGTWHLQRRQPFSFSAHTIYKTGQPKINHSHIAGFWTIHSNNQKAKWPWIHITGGGEKENKEKEGVIEWVSECVSELTASGKREIWPAGWWLTEILVRKEAFRRTC